MKVKKSISLKKTWADPEYRAKQIVAQKAIQRIAQNRTEVNIKRSASLKITASRLEVKARLSASSKESQNRPEVKKKHVENMLRFWADPKNRIRMLQVMNKNSRNKQTIPEKQLNEVL